MLRLLWSHCRDIRVEVFNNKVIYNIPLANDLIFKYANVTYIDNSLRVIISQGQVQPHLEVFSLHTAKSEKGLLGENEKYLRLNQQASREMK
jgi:hypothetical protein